MGYNIGPKIGIDGEKEFRDQIGKLNRSYKTLEAETKAVTAAFDANGDEQGKLQKLTEQLQKQIDVQKQKVSLLSDAVEKATAKYGEESEEVNRLKGVMYDAQATMSGLEGELKDVTRRLEQGTEEMDDLGDQTEQTAKQVVDFGDILAANMLSDAIMDGLQELGNKLGDIAQESVQAAADVAAETAQFEQTFGDMRDAATAALQEISNVTHIATTRLQGSFSKLYAFAKTTGADNEQALNLASRALMAAADSAAYYDRSIEDTLESLQAFMKGNYANDAALGISCTETTRNTKANELYGKSFAQLSEAQKPEVLLAMAEAGNAASGALGQAAREADAWTNITGELTEAWRQLLAKAGAPVLKKITPIVKKITDSLYTIAEDIDWDKFGEVVSSTIDFLIDNLPQIATGLKAVGIGFAAMKLTKTAADIGSTVKELVTMVGAAKSAGAAVKAAATAMNTTPWGLAATAIGLVATALSAVVMSSIDAQKEITKSYDTFKSTIGSLNQEYTETMEGLDGNAAAAERYLRRLEDLEAEGLDNVEVQNEYATIIQALNDLYPDLNLQIDEHTGLLNQDKKAVEQYIKAQKKSAEIQAKTNLYTDLIEENERAKLELRKLQAEADKRWQESYQSYVGFWGHDQAVVEADADTAVIRKTISDMTAEIARNEAVVESLGNEIFSVGNTAQVAGAQIAAGADAAAQGNAKLQESYATAKAAAEESISAQIGLWDELEEENDRTAKKIVENWKKQQQAFANYDANLKKAVDLGLDTALIQQLSDGSIQSMNILDALVNDTNLSVDEINAAFAERMDAQGKIADTLGAVNLLTMPELQQIIEDARTSGQNIIQAIINGINRKLPELKKTMAKAATKYTKEPYDIEMRIASPARVMIPSGEHTIGGVIKGAENMFPDLEETMQKAGRITSASYLVPELEDFVYRASNYSPGNTTNVRTDYGGFHITINQLPGEDAEELAHRVMDVIQHEVDAKGAVFHA